VSQEQEQEQVIFFLPAMTLQVVEIASLSPVQFGPFCLWFPQFQSQQIKTL